MKPSFGDLRQINLENILNDQEKLFDFCEKVAEWGWDMAMKDSEDFMPGITGRELLEKQVEKILAKPL